MTTRSECVRASGLLAGSLMFLAAAPAWASTLIVGSGATPCPGADYTTIQSAVNAAAAGDELEVCPGTYAEQILVPAGKDGLVLRSREALGAIIKAPPTMTGPGDIVRINAAHDVTLAGFTIAGPLPDALFCSLEPRTGVRVDGGGSATIRANRIVDIRSADASLRGCQNGIAIEVGFEPDAAIGTARVEENTIEAFEKAGIVVDNAGSSAIIDGNVVTGAGPSSVIAQNGVQVSFGADAVITSNWVSGEIYTPSPEASGILLYLPGHVLVADNQVHNADYGIITVDAAGPEIRNNTTFACTANGIDLDESTIGTTGAVVAANDSHDNGEDGVYVSVSSKDNAIHENRMASDRELDARDDSSGHGTAGTANLWARNRCKTDNHGGLLCEPDR